MQTISPTAAHALPDAYIIDVREPDEVARARVDGAVHIPLGSLVDAVNIDGGITAWHRSGLPVVTGAPS